MNNDPQLQPIAARKKPRFRLTLFWKILLWFWLTIVVLITLFLFYGYISSDKIHYRPLPPPVEAELSHLAQQAENWLPVKRARTHRLGHRLQDIYLLDMQGDDRLGREVPELLSELHLRVKRHKMPLTAFRKEEAYFGGQMLKVENEVFWLYRQQKSRMFSGHLFRNFFHDVARILLVATFVISFPVSFILSWLITRPIRQLQQATLELKADLNQRDSLQRLALRSDEFAELAYDFEQMANHLASMLSSQKQLVSDVSHELRSPLTRLKIALGILEQRGEHAPAETIARIKLEADRMNEMLESLLTISKLEAQRLNAAKTPCDLTQLFTDVVADGQFEASQSGIRIVTHFPETCPFEGVADALISGIENILRNAIRFTGDKGTIHCRLSKQEHHILLQIEDNGPGVNSEHLTKLFDPFYRPDADRNRDSGGIGLGLSIARQAFALNKGEISASNIEPHGLRVEVRFRV